MTSQTTQPVDSKKKPAPKTTTASGIADKAFVAGTTVLEVKEMAETSYSTVEKVLGGPGNPVLNSMINLAEKLVDVGKVVPFIAPAFVILKVRT